MKSMVKLTSATHTPHSNLRQVTSSSSLRRFSKFCFQRISSPRISWAEHSGKCVAAKCSCIVLFTSASPQKKRSTCKHILEFSLQFLKGKKINTFLGPARVKEFNGVDLVSEKIKSTPGHIANPLRTWELTFLYRWIVISHLCQWVRVTELVYKYIVPSHKVAWVLARRVDRNTLLLSYKYPLCRGFTTHQKII